jgi:selenocysteine-specific translation elongation factor
VLFRSTDGRIVKELKKKMRKTIYPVSAVTGSGIKELKEVLWEKIKETKYTAEK